MYSLPFHLLNVLSSLAFVGYGICCIGTEGMKQEFHRFGLSRFRVIVGSTQIIGAVALTLGPWFTVLGLFAAAGLSVQMFLGVLVRIRVRDSLAQTAQALGFLAVNLFLFLVYLQNL